MRRPAAYRPTARQELCIRAALLPGAPALAAWRRLLATTHLHRLDPASRSLLPLVYRNIGSHGLREADAIEVLKERYLDVFGRNQRFFDGALPLVRALDDAGLEPIALKGLALVARFYRDAGARPMADVDVLVRRRDVERAALVAAGLGWRPRYALTPAFLRVKHAGPLDHPAGIACDLHWRVFEEAGADGADEAFRSAAERVRFQGATLRVLSPTDQLLHVCGHAARWAPAPALRWVVDAMLILRDEPIDWPRLVAQTAERRFVLRMREMLGYLASGLGAPVPIAALADLDRLPVSTLERFEHRVRTREQQLLGELPTYVFNCLRAERRPVRALPGYLRDAWGLPSLGAVPRRLLALAIRRLSLSLRGRGPG